ncbi:hypothetical protein PMAYCL1PPCAC_16645 [Pristionchus mayeri]|uniref:Uncharacterized protein n=1 Tax=Pristionchus mayeri TaxID=1317129 RepID=A0AAN5CLC9_9BILA|nr:hypothetical protein PMAYCL1PPCAC_16645 [Pristionchus mayeri]
MGNYSINCSSACRSVLPPLARSMLEHIKRWQTSSMGFRLSFANASDVYPSDERAHLDVLLILIVFLLIAAAVAVVFHYFKENPAQRKMRVIRLSRSHMERERKGIAKFMLKNDRDIVIMVHEYV